MTLLAGTTDGFIEHLEFRDTRLFWKSRYRAHSAAVRRIRVVEEGIFASAGEDNLVKLWKRDSWKELGRIGHENFATDIVRSKSRYLSCSYDGTILQTSLELERELHEH